MVTLERDGLQDMVTSTMEFKEWGETPLEGEEVAGEEVEEGNNVAVEKEEEEDAPSVAGMSVEESHSVARDEKAEEAEMAVANEAGEREENTAGEMEDFKFVPEMAKNCNRFRGDVVEEVDSIPDPLILSCVDGLVRLRKVKLEAEGGWPALGNRGVSEIVKGVGAERNLGSSSDEDAIIGGVIVAGSASQKENNAARRGKKKNQRNEISG